MYAEGRYDETDIGQRIMCVSSSEGLYKGGPGAIRSMLKAESAESVHSDS